METYDERFTTTLARRASRRREDARAAAHLLESYLDVAEQAADARRATRRAAGRLAWPSRRAAVLLVGAAGSRSPALGRHAPSRRAERACDDRVPPPPKPFHIVFPEGFTRKEMAAARRRRPPTSHRRKRKVTPRLSGNAYRAAKAAQRRRRASEASRRRTSRASSSRRPTSSRRRRPRSSSSPTRSSTSDENWAKVDLRVRETKKLTPYDVLIIASMVEKETIAPEERPMVAAVIYNRLKARMPLGIDATIRYGLDIPATESMRESQLESDTPTTRATARACRRRRSRTRASRRCRRPLIRRR